LPPAFTTDWFTYAWKNFDLGQMLGVTLLILLVGGPSLRSPDTDGVQAGSLKLLRLAGCAMPPRASTATSWLPVAAGLC